MVPVIGVLLFALAVESHEMGGTPDLETAKQQLTTIYQNRQPVDYSTMNK